MLKGVAYPIMRRTKWAYRPLKRLKRPRRDTLQSKMTLPHQKVCPVCKKEFFGRSSFSKNCSVECARKNKPKYGVTKSCQKCGNPFYVWQCQKNTKFCSRKCAYADHAIEKICRFCGGKYERALSQVNYRGSSFCSQECKNKFGKLRAWEYKKKSRTNNVKLKKKLWSIFSQYIRQRDKGICISCGKEFFWRRMDAGHYIPKSLGLSLYFDERNVNCQCTYCNRWMHGNLSQYALALIRKYGETILADLEVERKKIVKISDEEYLTKIELYKQKLVDLGQNNNIKIL